MNPAGASRVAWLPTLGAIVLVQTACAYLTRIVPTLAPIVTADLGLSDASIGYLAGLNMAGSIAFLVTGTPVIRRLGPLRTLQAGLLLGLLGLAAMAIPSAIALALASVLVGVGYAPSAPAGNEILHRFAPPAHRTLIFSIKQAGVPVGGVIAGLLLPTIADRFGWHGALVASAVIVVATIALVQARRADTDRSRDPTVSVTPRSLLRPENLAHPLSILFANPALRRLALAGLCLSVGQGVWLTFLVAMSVSHLGLDLPAAGLLFAITQATGIAGRLLLGSLADRIGSGRLTLRITVAASALTSLVMAFASPAWPFGLLCALAALAGVTVASWNGVQLAEIAKHAPPGQIAEASSGAVIVIFLGYVASPVLFGALLTASGRWDAGFAAVALATAAGLLALRR